MIRIHNLKLAPGQAEASLKQLAAKALRISPDSIRQLKIHRRSIDARDRQAVRILYTVDVAVPRESFLLRRAKKGQVEPVRAVKYVIPSVSAAVTDRPVVVGFGPAGIFAALILAEAGRRPIVCERGRDALRRRQDVESFWRGEALDPGSNVQFGEGGAGTFSDGKLNTGIHDLRIGWVLSQLHKAGAPADITYDAKPHVGTDLLITVVQNLRRRIEALGGEVRFETQITGLQSERGQLTGLQTTAGPIACRSAIFAIGHSARDTYEMLLEQGIPMEPKAFSMGVRIEQRQAVISRTQYGAFAPLLPAASYKLSCHLPDGGSAYTFCMCPGGYVVAAASEAGGVVTNGMSNSARDGENANAALLVTLTPEQFPDRSALGGMYWQRQLEQAAFLAGGGNYHAPAQLVADFLARRPTTALGTVQPTYRPGVTLCDLHTVLPPDITAVLEQALPVLEQKLPGFAAPDAVLTAPETRSSAPVRIVRDAQFQSALRGLYPCGEGAGYAGGITSAAVDGMKCAEALIAQYS